MPQTDRFIKHMTINSMTIEEMKEIIDNPNQIKFASDFAAINGISLTSFRLYFFCGLSERISDDQRINLLDIPSPAIIDILNVFEGLSEETPTINVDRFLPSTITIKDDLTDLKDFRVKCSRVKDKKGI